MNSDFKEYVIAKIGEIVDAENGQEDENVFTYNKREYKLLLPEINTRHLLQGILPFWVSETVLYYAQE